MSEIETVNGAPKVTALIQGKDTKGIIATITNWIFDHSGNIL